MFETWRAVDLETTWGAFEPGAVLFYTDDEGVVCDVRRDESKLKVRIQRSNGEQFTHEVKEKHALRDLARRLIPRDAWNLRAMVLPAVMWREDTLWAPRNLVGLAATTVVAIIGVVLMATLNMFGMAWLTITAALAAGVGARRLFKGGRLAFMAPDRLGLTMDTIHAYALTREQGRLWVPPTRGANRRQLALLRVDAIRTHYLEQREDIAYRIECSALFDPAVGATAAFEEALVAFDDVDDDTPTETVDALANEVELAFNTAQANAERLGYRHLPEDSRAPAQRAAKAARLADGATTPGERVAALAQVKRILDSLALYYLPTLDERRALEGPTA